MTTKTSKWAAVGGASSVALVLVAVLLAVAPTPRAQADPAAPSATTRYVAPSGVDTGVCNVITLPCRTIQFAVDKAASTDVILVAQGVYTQTNGRPRDDIVASGSVTQVVYISKTITIKGGYTTTNNFASSLPLTQVTTINPQAKGRGVYIANGSTGTLIDLRLTNGNANGMGGGANTSEDAGGGLYAYGGNLLLTGATIFNNSADAGGGVYFNNMTLVIATTSAIVTNTATISGGGVYIKDSPVVVWTTSDFSGNNATKSGGGIGTENSAIQLSDSTINRNSAGSTGGGGIRLLFSDGAIINGNTFMQNNSGIGNAGALFLERSDATVAGNTMISNTAGAGGAMYIFFSNAGLVSGNIMRANTSTGDGGGLVLHSTIIKLINNVIVDNRLTGSTHKGSGIFVQQSAARLQHNTIARNTGGDNSGFSFSTLVPSAPIVLTNTIIVNQGVGITTTAGNTVTVRGVLWFGNSTNATGQGPISIASPFTGTPSFAPDGYHILPGSTAIDNGINAGVTTDIDGDSRPLGPKPDLGADELAPLPDVVLSKFSRAQAVTSTVGVVKWVVAITNAGTLTATNVRFTDTPALELYVSSVNGSGPCSFFGNGVACNAPQNLAAGATVTFTVSTAFASAPVCDEALVNNAVVSADGELNTANNSAQAQTQYICTEKLYLPLILR